jgi:uncharacterized protein YceK
MLRRILLAAGCAAVVASAGCGTLANQNGYCWYMTCAGGPVEPYGGVQQDWLEVRSSWHEVTGDRADTGSTVMGALAAIDLPLSAVGDTILLPYHLWVTMADRGDQSDADKPTDTK